MVWKIVPLNMEQRANMTTWRTFEKGLFVPVNFKISETMINVPIVAPVLEPRAGITAY